MAVSTIEKNGDVGEAKSARLEWGDGRGLVIALDPGDPYKLGRSTSCNVQLDLPSVSGHHAELRFREGLWTLKDLGSTNGTFINGRPVVEGELSHGDEITLGTVVLRFVIAGLIGDRPSPYPVSSSTTPTSTPQRGTPGFSSSILAGWSRPILAISSFIAGALLVALLFSFMGGDREPIPATTPQTAIVAVVPESEEVAEAPPLGEETMARPAVTVSRPAWDRLPLASFDDIFHARTQERRVVRLDRNPRILVFDFPDLESQARMFNRLAALIEKHGLPKDRVVRHYELADYIARDGKAEATFYYGHDYSSAALAHFFQLVAMDNDDPRDDERVLRDLLLDLGVIQYSNGVYTSGDPPMGLVTIVQEGNPSSGGGQVSMGVRHTILRHELSHGEFFTNEEYRDYVMWFWHNEMTEEERGFFRDFLSKSDYNPQDDVLMANEMQAYLMHTDNDRAFNPDMLGISWEEISDLRKRFAERAPETWMDEVFGRLE